MRSGIYMALLPMTRSSLRPSIGSSSISNGSDDDSISASMPFEPPFIVAPRLLPSFHTTISPMMLPACAAKGKGARALAFSAKTRTKIYQGSEGACGGIPASAPSRP